MGTAKCAAERNAWVKACNMTRLLYESIVGAILIALAIGSNSSGPDPTLSDNQRLSRLLNVTSKLTSDAEDQLTNLIDSGHTSLEDIAEVMPAPEEPFAATAETHAVGGDDKIQSQLGKSDGWTKVDAELQSHPRIEEFEDALPDKLFPSISTSIDPLVQEASENLSRAAWEFVHPLSPSPPPDDKMDQMDEMMPPVAEVKASEDTLKAANMADKRTAIKMGIADVQEAKRDVENKAVKPKATTHDVKHPLAHVVATELPDPHNRANNSDPDVVITKMSPVEVKDTQSTPDTERTAAHKHESASQLQTSNVPSGGAAASKHQPIEVGDTMRDANTKDVDSIQSTDTKEEPAHSEDRDTNKDANGRAESKTPRGLKALERAMLVTDQSPDAEVDASGLKVEPEATLPISAADAVQPEMPNHVQ